MCLGGRWWWVRVACTLAVLVGGWRVKAEECDQGVRCSQCPAEHYTRASNGTLLCCPSCAAAVLYHGDFPTSWCACYAGLPSRSPRVIRLPDPARLLVGGGGEHPAGSASFQDAFYIINNRPAGLVSQRLPRATQGMFTTPLQGQGISAGHPGSSSGVSPAVQHALTLLADTLENLHARVTRLEGIITRSQNLHQSGSFNRVGTTVPLTLPPTPSPSTPVPPTPPIERSCPTNYSKIGDHCFYVSVWHDYRAIWKDAMTACEGLNGKLAEPLTRLEFLDLTRQLSSIPSASGFSYWLGGLYPGLSWLWSYAGKKVNLNPAYWTEKDSKGAVITPGDTISGRCLSLAYTINASKYYYMADECGFEKYFLCQLIEGGEQRTIEV